MLLALGIFWAVLIIPTALAWYSWYKSARLQLPMWRNIVGVISLMFTPAALWLRITLDSMPREYFADLRLFFLIAFVCAWMLSGRARVLAVIAVLTNFFLFQIQVIA